MNISLKPITHNHISSVRSGLTLPKLGLLVVLVVLYNLDIDQWISDCPRVAEAIEKWTGSSEKTFEQNVAEFRQEKQGR